MYGEQMYTLIRAAHIMATVLSMADRARLVQETLDHIKLGPGCQSPLEMIIVKNVVRPILGKFLSLMMEHQETI
jgi:hypothetical protein